MHASRQRLVRFVMRMYWNGSGVRFADMPDGGLTADMLDLDLDVLAQLDDAAEHCDDWAIDDDFVARAEGAVDYEIASGDEEYALPAGAGAWRGAGADEWETDDDDGDSDAANYSSEDDDVHRGEETRSRFTEYSMTSSIMHRNDKLQLLDEQFERVCFNSVG
jgi:protein LTV1